ncbi:MAG: nitroreductase [Halofilum sp. (in: g-proteobacteria)]|nr:nitroreductase [Halofilum sp. (in: g-proteobacteria)]
MDVLTLLHGRASVPADELDAPAPDGEALEAILRAGTSAPDHGGLRPWRFILIRGDARARLGEVFARALQARRPDADADELERQRAKALRAPLIIAVAARVDPDNAKVPVIEQLLSAGAATQQMALAANALGFGAVWLTGPNAHDATVAEALGLGFDDRLVALLHLGTPRHGFPPRTRPDPGAFVTEWHEPCALETL